MIRVSGLDKSFGARDLFKGADLQVFARDRVALLGPNGSGKTTLLEMIAGIQQPDGGEVNVARGVVIGYLPQETDALRGRPVIDEVMSAGTEVIDAQHRLEVLQNEIAEMGPGAERDKLMGEYGRLQDRFATLGGYSLEQDARRILAGLGFKEDEVDRPTETFSGGWMMRIALAKLLLSAPDLLMLDEPTNHLDVESVEWLEHFLGDYEGAVLLISHDREFINSIATKVVEIDDLKLVSYSGNFEAFVAQREAYVAQKLAAAKQQQREVEQIQKFIDRFRYKNTLASRVQSRVKMLEKMDRVDVPKQRRRSMKITFPTPPRSGRVVVSLDDVSFSYGDVPVYDGLTFALERSNKIALVGPNGAGKSTLLKLLAGVLEPQRGERRLGHNVSLGYFAQHQIEALDPARSVIDELETAVPSGVQVKLRDLLGRFLFSGDDIDKPVRVLSGGERTRLALAKLLVAPHNVLCLDEPTNHLDMMSRDVLEEGLIEYGGAIVLITHDRHVIRDVTNKIVEVVDGTVREFEGDYDYYLSKREREAGERTPAPATRPEGASARDRRRERAEARAKTKDLRDRIARLEADLERVGAEIAEITGILADPESYSSGADIGDLSRRYERAKQRARRLEGEWTEAVERLEAADA